MKKITLKRAKKKAWDAFSVFIRTSAPPLSSTKKTCYTCGIVKDWREMDAGHGIPGRNNAVLFMEEVVKNQCQQCNRFKHGRLDVFTVKLIDDMGRSKYDELVSLSKQTVQYKTYQYLEIYEKYKQKANEYLKI